MDAARRSPLARAGLDRLLILGSLGLLTALAWAYLVLLSAAMARGDMALMGLPSMPAADNTMPGMADMSAMTTPAPWDGTTVVLMFLMWTVMMIGMMIPSALPAILLYARVQRHYLAPGLAARMSAFFVTGYLLAWAGFSLIATLAQWAADASGLLSPMSMRVSAGIGAALFAVAGLYQLSPLKNVCLRRCRAPAEFLAAHRRPGLKGALATGLHHGLYCVGCCWALMALLFAGGIMNLLWIALLAIFVLVEKLFPYGHRLARIGGIGMLIVAAFLFQAATRAG